MSEDLDTCDRCGTPQERIYVGHSDKGYDGLCATCLDAWPWQNTTPETPPDAR
jgi:hypothetical protein